MTLQSANTSGGERTALVVGLRPYGISRILMKFPGIDFSEYEGVTITSVTVSLRDIMCEDTEMTLSCYPFTGDAWEESTATWEGMNQSWGTLLDSHVISYYAEDGIASTHWYAFDISAAVQAWVDGDTTITPEKGLIFKADSAVENDTAQESRTFGSFERTNHKPVFSMTYQSGITLSHSSAELYVGDTLPLTATTAPAGQAVTWHSDNAAVASVDDNGVVTGLSEGTSTITAMLADGTSAQCIVHVMGKAISLNCSSVNVYKGNTVTLTATTVPAGETIEWTSLNEDIATVENGVVTGIGQGQTTIRASISQNVYADCLVNVQLQEIYINGTAEELGAGDFCLLTVTTVPAGAQVYWNSEDDSIATVTPTGKVDGIAPGQTIITASLEDGTTATYAIKVVEKQSTLNYTSVDIREASPFPLIATTVPANRMVEWRSSDTEIATVSSTGLVSAKKAGKVTITASMPGGPSTTCTVYVKLTDGVYYMHFPNETVDYHLQPTLLKNSVSNDMVLYTKASDNEPTTTRIAQMWRITYIGNGFYTIRPLNNLDMCLYANNNLENGYRYVVNYRELADRLDDVPLQAQWSISWMGNGYALLAYGDTNRALTTYGGFQVNNVSVIVDTYLDTESNFQWTLTPVTNVPTGLALYDKNTGLPAETTPSTYIAPEETRSLRLLNYEMVVFPDKSLKNKMQYIVGNQAIAVENGNGTFTGVATGSTSIIAKLNNSNATETIEFPLIVTEISNGTYFLRNKTTGCYADIDGQVMENNRTIHQWELHGGNTQKWTFTHLGDGTYSIHSENSTTKYYLGIKDDSSTLDQDVVLRTGSITSGMKWSVTPGTNGAFILTPKSGETNGYVLATSTSFATNGKKLIQGDYLDNNSYRDEWILAKVYSLSLNIYYDHAFAARHSTAETLINSFQPRANEVLGQIFGLTINWNTPQKIYSTPDYCKLNCGIGINSDTVNAMCPANPSLDEPNCNYYDVNYNKHANNPMSQYFLCENCTSYYQIYHDFIKTYPGNDVTASVLFTGSALYDDEGNCATGAISGTITEFLCKEFQVLLRSILMLSS